MLRDTEKCSEGFGNTEDMVSRNSPKAPRNTHGPTVLCSAARGAWAETLSLGGASAWAAPHKTPQIH